MACNNNNIRNPTEGAKQVDVIGVEGKREMTLVSCYHLNCSMLGKPPNATG